MFDTLEEAFAEVARRGLMVNNLMQVGPGCFRASLRMQAPHLAYSGFSEAKTPLNAMNKVLVEHGVFQQWAGYTPPKAAQRTAADLLK
jgi:Tfp pilus assembly protein PilN